VLFLVLSSAFGMQYLSWALATAYLIGFWVATAYNVAASVFAVAAYSHLNRAYPWDWYEARGTPLRTPHFVLMTITWLTLAVVAVAGIRSGLKGNGQPALRPQRRRELPAEVDQPSHDVPIG
jgi:hypothetical protein